MVHDFRPDYLRIGELRRKLNVPLAAFTATADAETRREIIERLFDGVLPKTFLRRFDRPNIHTSFQPKRQPSETNSQLCSGAKSTVWSRIL